MGALTRLLSNTAVAIHIILLLESVAPVSGRIVTRQDVSLERYPIVWSDVAGYLVEVQLGMQPQSINLTLTSEWETYLPVRPCEPEPSMPCSDRYFHANESTTFHNATGRNNMTTMTCGATGTFYEDIAIGDSSIFVQNASLLYSDPPYAWGSLGLGAPVGNWSDEESCDDEYENAFYSDRPILLSLARQNLIATPAYSLWFNPRGEPRGQLALGAIDTSKYRGSLTSISLYPLGDGGAYVVLTSITASSPTGEDAINLSSTYVELSWNGNQCYLPQDLAEVIWDIVGATYIPDGGGGFGFPAVPCFMKESVGNFTLALGGPSGVTITVPMHALVIDNIPTNSTNEAGEELCHFAIVNSTFPATYALSVTLLRTAYMVADPTNGRIAFAEAIPADDIDGGESAAVMVPFDGPSAPIPSATAAPDQGEPRFLTSLPAQGSSVVLATATTYAAAAGFTETRQPTPDESDSDSDSRDLQIGLGVGLSLGICTLLLIAFLVWRRFYRARRSQVKEVPSPGGTSVDGTQPSNPTELSPDSEVKPSHTELPSEDRQVSMLSHVYPPTAEVEGERLPPLQQPREMYTDPSQAGYMDAAELAGEQLGQKRNH